MTNAEKLEHLANIRSSLDRVYAVVVDYFDQLRKGKRPLLILKKEGEQLNLLTSRDEYGDLPTVLRALRRARLNIDEDVEVGTDLRKSISALVGLTWTVFEDNLAERDVAKTDEICAMITYIYGHCIVSVDYCEALAGKQETLSKGYCPYDSTHKLATFTEGDDEQ